MYGVALNMNSWGQVYHFQLSGYCLGLGSSFLLYSFSSATKSELKQSLPGHVWTSHEGLMPPWEAQHAAL